MYFGGEIVLAKECDYESSKRLGLICPFCNSAVFLRSESIRHVKNKMQIVSPYFAHYPSGSVDNWDCENRSHTKEGKEKIEQIKIQARNQRLKIYNAYLWNMFQTDRNIPYSALNLIRSRFGNKWCQANSIIARQEWSESLELVYELIPDSIEAMHQLQGFPTEGKPPFMTEEDYKEEVQKQKAYISNCDRRLHKAICFEIAEFLATNTAGYAFEKFFKFCIYCQILLLTEQKKFTEDMIEKRYVSITAQLAGLIAGTHWIEQINAKMEAT